MNGTSLCSLLDDTARQGSMSPHPTLRSIANEYACKANNSALNALSNILIHSDYATVVLLGDKYKSTHQKWNDAVLHLIKQYPHRQCTVSIVHLRPDILGLDG